MEFDTALNVRSQDGPGQELPSMGKAFAVPAHQASAVHHSPAHRIVVSLRIG